MSITKKLTNCMAISGVLLAATMTSTGAFADTLPGIVDSSFPQFINTVSIKRGNGPSSNTWNIKAKNGADSTSQFFTDVFTGYEISAAKFSATVVWTPIAGTDKGTFSSGSMSIEGKITSEGIGKQTLMTADLVSYEWDTGAFLGFNTANIVCSPDLNMLIGGGGCTTNESLIIKLKNGWNGDQLTKGLNLSGTATTSVPLPAAVWLFVSGLGLMGVTTRRRKQKTTV